MYLKSVLSLLMMAIISKCVECSTSPSLHGSHNTTLAIKEKRAQQQGSSSGAPASGGNAGLGPSTAPLPKSSKSKKLSKQFRTKQKLLTQALKNDLISKTINRFEGKHLYENGKAKDINGKPLDSFQQLASDPTHAKQYLLDLNRKVYKGGILPDTTSGGQVNEWLRNIDNVKVSIIDANISVLKTDINSKFDAWKTTQPLTPSGQLPPKTIIPNFMTDNVYPVTHITFSVDSSGNNVKVNAEQILTKVELGTDEYGKPSHFEGLDPSGPQSSPKPNADIASFTKLELETNAQINEKLWKALGVPSNAKNVVLNENSDLYRGLKASADNDFKTKTSSGVSGSSTWGVGIPPGTCTTSGRRKRATGLGSGKCAIILKPDGKVKSVLPKEFLEEYKKADEKGKQQMTELVENNKEKVVIKGIEGFDDAKKLQNLVDLEEIKYHVGAVETVSKVERTRVLVEGDEDPIVVLEGWGEKLDSIKGNVKLGSSKIVHGIHKVISSKGGVQLIQGSNSVANPLGKFFLAKTVINGIIQRDTTSLVIVGARLGIEFSTDKATQAGSVYFSTGSKMGKVTNFLGNQAGPIGAVLDIELSAWSITKAVQRLNKATNKYEKYDAIADIVAESIDIAVTAAVTVLSVAFPPAAPLFIAVGIVANLLTQLTVAAFKAANEMDRINYEVPLLDFEKVYVIDSRTFDWHGIREPDYIVNLLQEKSANDLAVENSLKFMEDHQDFRGIVLPSRTLKYDGGCDISKFTEGHEQAWPCKLLFGLGCTMYINAEQIGFGCDWGRPCGPMGEICENTKEPIGDGNYTGTECVCSRSATTTYGLPNPNSMVNFRENRTIFWERSVPTEVENGVFQCKPGTLRYIDYKVSQPESRWGYLCENSIGLLQPSSRTREGQIMLFDLGDGDDKVFLEDEDSGIPNIFKMGNEGVKKFHGGGGRDEFVFDSNCSKSLRGWFDGGKGADGILLGKNCTKGQEIQIDFWRGRLSSNGNNLTMDFEGIEVLRGRVGQKEIVQVACTTRQVLAGGGTLIEPDEVIISGNNNGNCEHNVTVVAAAHTKVGSSARKGNITVLIDSPWTGMSVNVEAHSRKFLKFQISFLNTSSSQVSDWSLEKRGPTLELILWSLDDHIQFKFRIMKDGEKDIPISFTEAQGSSNSVLLLSNEDEEATATFYHFLAKNDEYLNRTGCRSLKNVFEITGDLWNVVGGDKSDEFILNTSKVGMLDGGRGVDIVKFHQDFMESVQLDLRSEQIRSVENVSGLAGVPLTVRTACDTMFITTQGGSLTEPDLVIIPEGYCEKRRTQIMVLGHTRVVMEGGSRQMQDDIVLVVADGNTERDLQFVLEATSCFIANLQVAIVVSHRNWTVVEERRNVSNESIWVHLEGVSENGKEEWIKFNLKDDINATGPFLEFPHLQVSVGDSVGDVPGILLFERVSGSPKMLFQQHESSTDNSSVVSNSLNGFVGLENIFRLNASDTDWEASGGNMNDVFVIFTTEKHGGRYVIHGGGGEENSLIVENGEKDFKGTFLVNLVKSEIGFLNAPSEKRGSIVDVQHIIGREDAPDLIYPTCSTKSVNGRDGQGDGHKMDIITIGYHTCHFKLLTSVGKFTQVKNTAPKGEFTYHVEDLMTSSLELQPTIDNVHLIKFAFHSWQFLSAVAFNETTRAMGWKLSDGQQERVQVFKLSRSPHSIEFNNPVFQFQPDGSSVSSKIRVTAEGLTMATFTVYGTSSPESVYGLGVDVNRFLVNITTKDISQNPRGEIHGCSDGNRCSANQFWIFSLTSPLELLDGGDCDDDACTNFLHFPQNVSDGGQLHVDMNTMQGKVTDSEGKVLIARLKNMHELHGTSEISAYVTCDTTKVTNVGQVVITADYCQRDLVIGLEEYTSVWFQKEDTSAKDNLLEGDNQDSEPLFPDSVHYHFTRPRSFDPEGDFNAILSSIHNYYLPFDLNSLSGLRFDADNEHLFYIVNGIEYFLQMLSSPGYDEQFYSQPNIVTHDGYKLQVARDHSLWATLGNSSKEIGSDSVPELERLANSLSVTIVIQTSSEFFFIGHSTNGQDRNVLQNMANVTSHLCGGGANDTIYEVVHLDNDVFIYTGYSKGSQDDDEDTYESESKQKQTIDLTDVIVPIRTQSETKYVPKTSVDEDNLVISMVGYEDTNPGRVIIVGGAYPWVARRLQLLLNYAIMDFVSVTEEKRDLRNRARRSGYQWTIRPRPVVIPADITVFSVSPEDLEDGHDIQLQSTNDSGILSNDFTVLRKGADLYMTNIMSSHETGIKTVKINDFFQQAEAENMEKEHVPTAILTSVTVHLPGLKLMLNESKVINLTMNGYIAPNVTIEHATATVAKWKEALFQLEEALLESIPEIERVFYDEDVGKFCSAATANFFAIMFCDIWNGNGLNVPQLLVGGAFLAILFSICGLIWWKMRKKSSKYDAKKRKTRKSYHSSECSAEDEKKDGLELTDFPKMGDPDVKTDNSILTE